MIACLFSGQGSQKKGMGKGLFERFPTLVDCADDLLGYSSKACCLENPGRQLQQTAVTQPMLFLVNAMLYLEKFEKLGIKPDYLAGHSLGEFNALWAAGVFDFETGLRLVQHRGKLMQEAKLGRMAAITQTEVTQLEGLLAAPEFNEVSIANYNTANQVVISGVPEALEKARKAIDTHQLGEFIPLRVSGAFHSPLMETAKQAFVNVLEKASLKPPKIPVISNVTARPFEANTLRKHLEMQLISPVQWYKGMQYLIAQGAMLFEEIGPGSVLTKLTQQILNSKPVEYAT